MKRIPEIRYAIEEYIYNVIVPKYAAFDPAHREDHALAVIDNSMDLYRKAPEGIRTGIDPEILATAAAAHDLGRIYGKKDHHINSGIIIRNDSSLRKWFDTEQIEHIAQAAEVALTHFYDGTWDEIGGVTTTLGAADDAVGLPTDTWMLENYTVEEYEAQLAAMKDGSLVVDAEYPVTADNMDDAASLNGVLPNITINVV